MTLIELVLAITLGLVITGITVTSSRLIFSRISLSGHSGNLQLETIHFANSLSAQIRNSGKVVKYDYQSISIISHEHQDTVKWEFSAGRMLKNKEEIKPESDDMQITGFNIRKIEEGMALFGKCDLIEMEFNARNRKNRETGTRLLLAVPHTN
jgi:hypothetical protein